LKSRIERLPGQWETVIFDAPPVLDGPDAAVLASYVDVVLVVVDPRRSSARATAQAVSSLNAVGAQILGVVLNRESDGPGPGLAPMPRADVAADRPTTRQPVSGSSRDRAP